MHHKTASQVILEILATIAVIAGILRIALGIWFGFDIAANPDAVHMTATAATQMGIAAGVLFVVRGLINLIWGLLGVHGANNPHRVKPFWVICVLALILNCVLLGFIFAMSPGTNGTPLAEQIGATIYSIIMFVLANNVKKLATQE